MTYVLLRRRNDADLSFTWTRRMIKYRSAISPAPGKPLSKLILHLHGYPWDGPGWAGMGRDGQGRAGIGRDRQEWTWISSSHR